MKLKGPELKQELNQLRLTQQTQRRCHNVGRLVILTLPVCWKKMFRGCHLTTLLQR